MKLTQQTMIALGIFVIIFLFLLTTISISWQHKYQKITNNQNTITNQASTKKKKYKQKSYQKTPKLYWPFYMFEGIPLVQIRLKSQPHVPITCILDSGSKFLNVASKTCDVCRNHHGVYTSPVHEKNQFVIEYGTQQDVVQVEQDKMFIRTNQYSNKDETIDINVHVTVERSQDSSNFNVLGISRSGFLRNVLQPAHQALLICFKPNNRTGFVTTISSDEAQSYQSCALVHVPLTMSVLLPYYIVRIQSLKIGHVTVPSPKYCILDTGSNVISVPSQTYKGIIDYLESSSSSTKSNSSSSDQSLYLNFSGQRSADNKKSTQTMAISKNRFVHGKELWIDDDVPNFGLGPTMILGCNGMLGYSFIFTGNYMSVIVSDRNVCNNVVHDV